MNKKYCYPSNFLALKFLQILIGSVDFFFFRTFFFFEYAKQRKRKYKFKINNSNNDVRMLFEFIMPLCGIFVLAAWLLSRLAASKKLLREQPVGKFLYVA